MIKTTKHWKVLELLNWTAEYLSEKKFESARLNAERLLSYALNMKRVELYLNYDQPLTENELLRFKEYLRRRLKREPWQYILGETEFMSLPFKVNPGVLIPRPETEILVETVLLKCQEKFPSQKTIAILDIGTGSGCIAVALAKYLAQAQVTAIDKSEKALKTASENARLNEVSDKIQFLKIDFLDSDIVNKLTEKFDVLVSNPPYVSAHDVDKLPTEIKYFEPEMALTDRKDGLFFFSKDCSKILAAFKSIWMYCGGSRNGTGAVGARNICIVQFFAC
ncbi:MAG: peptide chain release factor N(5)-glutamine methyltransferase [bacterium]